MIENPKETKSTCANLKPIGGYEPMKINAIIFLTCMLAILDTSTGQTSYIPYDLGGDNYYTMNGSPDIFADISGTDEFERGDTATLYIDLTNQGGIIDFKTYQIPQNPKEFALADAELQEEYKKPNALGITATLTSDDPQIEVKSGDQVIESLKSKDKTQAPLEFTIKIGDHAPAGEYPLKLNISYDYQEDVRVSASRLITTEGSSNLVDYKVSYLYHKANQTIPMAITVKRQADFEILNASGILLAGAKMEPVYATYKNIGEEPIMDGVAVLSIFKPFSSTDDQAFIGALKPGEEREVVFRLDVESDATPKEYGIFSEIKYSDVNGRTVISKSMKIPVTVQSASSSLLLPAAVLLLILAAAGGYWHKRKKSA
jgi:hypothetical protein